MHIADGVLSTGLMVGLNVAAGCGVCAAAGRLDYERVPRVGVMSAVFFLASFVHVKLGPSSVHLLLNGLLGLLLGWASLPAVGVALFLQATMLGHGGLTAWGANVLIMGVPAGVVWHLFGGACRRAKTPRGAGLWGAAAGSVAVLLTCALMAAGLHGSDPTKYAMAVRVLVLAHLPVAVIEAGVVGAAVGFLKRVRPDLLDVPVRGGRAVG